MAAKKETRKNVYYGNAPFGCGFKVGKTEVWLNYDETIKLTEAQAENPLAQQLIRRSDNGS